MKARIIFLSSLLITATIIFTSAREPSMHNPSAAMDPPVTVKRYLYVAVPGIRDYLGYGGHGILVFDINNQHRFVKRHPLPKGFIPIILLPM
jgi:hypothetical protein